MTVLLIQAQTQRIVYDVSDFNFSVILPPTLERSQVTSVKKFMKVQLIGLLRHPRAIDFYDNITNLLTCLGAKLSDVRITQDFFKNSQNLILYVDLIDL